MELDGLGQAEGVSRRSRGRLVSRTPASSSGCRNRRCRVRFRRWKQELSVSLFHRHARGLILTEQGELLYRTAHEVFMKLEAARTKLTDSRERPNGELKVSTTPGHRRALAHAAAWRISGPLSGHPNHAHHHRRGARPGDARGRCRDPPAAADPARPDPAQAVFRAFPRLRLARLPQAVRHAADARRTRQASHYSSRWRRGAAHLQNRRWLLEIRPRRQRSAHAASDSEQRARRSARLPTRARYRRAARLSRRRKRRAWCSCSAKPTRSRSTPILFIRKSSSRSRASRSFATSW